VVPAIKYPFKPSGEVGGCILFDLFSLREMKESGYSMVLRYRRKSPSYFFCSFFFIMVYNYIMCFKIINRLFTHPILRKFLVRGKTDGCTFNWC
jgi:hypothetical protein